MLTWTELEMGDGEGGGEESEAGPASRAVISIDL